MAMFIYNVSEVTVLCSTVHENILNIIVIKCFLGLTLS